METIKKKLINVYILAMEKAFYFMMDEDEEYSLDDLIVVETTRGIELGKVVSLPKERDVLETDEYPKVIRKGSKYDMETYEFNVARAKDAISFTQKEADALNLDMKIVSADYMLDGTKIILFFLSESRVDFRDLLKVLANSFKCRIELRQIGTRDKAKMIGGIGICGLKLCCSTFLNEFDGISITMAKNQMLALNIPKLSGHCGKLICCLKYENDVYTELQKELPRIGTRVRYENDIYKITSMNVITKMIRIENKDNIANVSYETIKDSLLPKDYPMNVPQPQVKETKVEEPKIEVPQEKEEIKERKPSFDNQRNKERNDNMNNNANGNNKPHHHFNNHNNHNNNQNHNKNRFNNNHHGNGFKHNNNNQGNKNDAKN